MIPALATKGFTITLVTRDPEATNNLKDSLRESNEISSAAAEAITIVKGDFTSASTLSPALQGHDTVISLLNRDVTAAQNTVTDATILAGVKHLIPAAFGIDTRRPEIRALPHLAARYIKSEEHLISAIAASGGQTSYTLIHTGGFLEWALKWGLFVNLASKGEGATVVFDSGDVEISSSSMHDIGTAVATAVLRFHEGDERVKNQILLVHSVTFSQNHLLGIARSILPDKPWPVTHADTVEAEAQSQKVWDETGGVGPASAWHGFFARAFFGKGLARFPDDGVSNDVLGVEMRDEAWLKGVIKEFLGA